MLSVYGDRVGSPESRHVVSLCESECLGSFLYSFGILHFEKITGIVENGDPHFWAPGTSTHLSTDLRLGIALASYDFNQVASKGLNESNVRT